MAISVEVRGVKELLADLRDFPEKLETSVLLQMSQIAKTSLQKGAGRHWDSGALYASVYNRKITGGREVGHDTNRAPYAQFVLFGTRPHVIRPKTKKALRWAGANGFIFAKIVNHPGYRGDDYMEVAKDDALAAFSTLVSKAIKDNL